MGSSNSGGSASRRRLDDGEYAMANEYWGDLSMHTCLKFISLLLAAIAGLGYFGSAGAQPKGSSSGFRWDDIKGKQPEPTWHRFAGEFPAGMLRRPRELTLDNWF